MSDIVTTQGAIITIDGDNDTALLTVSFVILPHVLPYPKERNMYNNSRVKRKGKACEIMWHAQRNAWCRGSGGSTVMVGRGQGSGCRGKEGWDQKKLIWHVEGLFGFVLPCWPRHMACGILVPRLGIKPTPPAMEAQCLNHWTTGPPCGRFLHWDFWLGWWICQGPVRKWKPLELFQTEGICAGSWLLSSSIIGWPNRQDGTSVVARAGGTVPRDGFTRAITWSSNQWPGGTTEGGASGGAGGAGATEETRLLPELVLKTERERTK